MVTYLYVSAQNDEVIRRYVVDPDDGRLTHQGDTVVPDGPAAMSLHPSESVLYVVHRGRGSLVTTGGDGVPRPEFALSSWSIERATGALTQTGRVQVDGECCFVTTDRRGRFVLSAYYQAGACAVHPIDSSGALGGAAIEWRKTHPGSHSFHVDPTNRFAFVPHIATGSGGLERLVTGPAEGLNAVLQFRFDETSGHLEPNDEPMMQLDDPVGPRHLCFHPRLPIVYVNGEQGSVVVTCSFDPDRGTLTPIETVGTVPSGAPGTNAPADLQLDPSGRFLYCSNRGHDSIASYAVDPDSGRLTPTGWTKVGERPRAFGIDPSGQFLYAASQATGTMRLLYIDQGTGELTPIEDYEVGTIPMWITFAALRQA